VNGSYLPSRVIVEVCAEKFHVGELNFQTNSPSSARYSLAQAVGECGPRP
jgi:hypothetical protein